MLEEYSVPPLFKEDLLSVLDKPVRPPFRWLVAGPSRSGASWHVDPALTSAWNTLLSGCKRCLLDLFMLCYIHHREFHFKKDLC